MNKIYYTLCLATISVSSLLAQAGNIDFSIGYRSNVPVSIMRESLKSAHGLNLGFQYKFCLSPISLGAEFGIMQYGQEKAPYYLESPSGNHITETDIKVNNNSNLALITARAYLAGYGMKIFNPYVDAGFGFASFRTNLRIEDPEDIDGCAPLVSEILHRDRAVAAKVGAGVSTDLVRLFAPGSSNTNHNRFFLDMNVGWLTGGKATYVGVINPDFVNNYNHYSGGSHSHGNNGNNTVRNPRGYDGTLNADFEHLPTGEIHSHAVGNKYTNRINMMSVNVSLLMRIGKGCRY